MNCQPDRFTNTLVQNDPGPQIRPYALPAGTSQKKQKKARAFPNSLVIHYVGHDVAIFRPAKRYAGSDLDLRCEALGGCWRGISVLRAGCGLATGKERLRIGDFCPHCPSGRIADDGRCNTCTKPRRLRARIANQPLSLDDLVRFMKDQTSLATTFRLREAHHHEPFPWGASYWVSQLMPRGEYDHRVALVGHPCPSCQLAQVVYAVDRSGDGDGLACRNPWCDFCLPIVRRLGLPCLKDIMNAQKQPLVEAPSPSIIRERLILLEAGFSIRTLIPPASLSRSTIRKAIIRSKTRIHIQWQDSELCQQVQSA